MVVAAERHDGALRHARAGPVRSFAVSRGTALSTARHDIATFQTLDYRAVDAGYQKWLDSSTGALRDDLQSSAAAAKKLITAAKNVTTGKVVDAAVTELADRAGTATVIAAVEITVTPEKGAAKMKRNRFTAAMTRTGVVWKINQLSQVPLGAS